MSYTKVNLVTHDYFHEKFPEFRMFDFDIWSCSDFRFLSACSKLALVLLTLNMGVLSIWACLELLTLRLILNRARVINFEHAQSNLL